MIDFGFDKLALISAVALIVIGPEKLPRVARTVGTLLGKAQRYVADVKAEVNRSIELEELKKMKTEFEDAARNVEQTVSNELHQTTTDLASAWQPPADTVPPLGSDLGGAVKGFKDGVRDGTASPADPAAPTQRVGAERTLDPGTVDVETKSRS